MLISETTGDFERFAGVEYASEVGDRVTACFEAARGAFSHNTERALRADVEIFTFWCRQHNPGGGARQRRHRRRLHRRHGARQVPCLRFAATSPASPPCTRRSGNPIRWRAPPSGSPCNGCTGIRGRRQTQVQGLTWPLRNRMLEVAGDRLIEIRNRALLAVAYDTLLRRSELVSLEVSDLLEDMDGSATLLVRSGKTDPDRRGAMLYLARDTVKLVRTWLEAGGIAEGFLFRSLRKDGAECGGSSTRARCRASTRGWRAAPGFPMPSSRLWPGTVPASGRFRI